MRNVQQIIQDQTDYILLQVALDILKQQGQLTQKEWRVATKKLVKRYDPPTRMLENYNGKRYQKTNP